MPAAQEIHGRGHGRSGKFPESQGKPALVIHRQPVFAESHGPQPPAGALQVDRVLPLGDPHQFEGETGRLGAGGDADQGDPAHHPIGVGGAVDQAMAEAGAVQDRKVGDHLRIGRDPARLQAGEHRLWG
jgi:hypothetical protein